MPEMSTLSSKSKVPMLPSQGFSYAKWGRWVDAFSSCLTHKGLHLFAALDSTMPVEFPEDEDEDESDVESDEEEDDIDEDVGPPQGCDVQIYESVIDLREKRLDLEDALQEIQKNVEELVPQK